MSAMTTRNSKYLRWALALTVLCGGLLAFASQEACNPNSCQDATDAMKASIDAVCEEAAFKGTAFCQCCVPAGFYSMEDTCTCRPLVLDADFCFYSDDHSGYPAVRSALVHAANVCENRSVMIPYGEGGSSSACVLHQSDASTQTDADADVSTLPDDASTTAEGG